MLLEFCVFDPMRSLFQLNISDLAVRQQHLPWVKIRKHGHYCVTLRERSLLDRMTGGRLLNVRERGFACVDAKDMQVSRGAPCRVGEERVASS